MSSYHFKDSNLQDYYVEVDEENKTTIKTKTQVLAEGSEEYKRVEDWIKTLERALA